MVHLKDARRYVCNPDGVLGQAAVDSTDALLFALERDKGVETVVVVVEHLEGDDPHQFGMELSRKYGIGSRTQNTGLIVILATGDRSYRILTGRGLEGTLPDALCRRIQNQVMVPLLKRENWDDAIVETMKAIDGVIRGDSSIAKDGEEETDPTVILLWSIAILLLVGVLMASIIKASIRKCPVCKKKSMRIVSRSFVRKNQRYYQRTKWKCQNCGHEEEEDQPTNMPNTNQGSTIPPIIFPMGGGRGGGGFGGGSFGGGGSGGRF